MTENECAPGSIESENAGLISRLIALGIDLAILTGAISIGTASISAALEMFFPSGLRWSTTFIGVAASLLPVTYFTLSWWISGQTLGAVVMGIRVVDRSGHAPGFSRSLIRSLGGLAFALLFLIGMLNTLVDPHRRALHDRVFGTRVIYCADAVALPRNSQRCCDS